MQAERTYLDLELFKEIEEGSETAFRQVFEHYAPLIHPMVNRIVKSEAVADEVLQEVFLKLWLSRSTLSDIENPKAWLTRIASNTAINYFRKQELDKRVLKEAATHTEADDLYDTLSYNELQTIIHEALQELSPKRRQVYHMIRDEGMSRRQVAEKLGISENTVKNQLGIAIQSIQEFIRRQTGYTLPALLILWAEKKF